MKTLTDSVREYIPAARPGLAGITDVRRFCIKCEQRKSNAGARMLVRGGIKVMVCKGCK